MAWAAPTQQPFLGEALSPHCHPDSKHKGLAASFSWSQPDAHTGMPCLGPAGTQIKQKTQPSPHDSSTAITNSRA